MVKGDVIFLRIKEPSIKSSIEDKKRRDLADMLKRQLLRKKELRIERNLEELSKGGIKDPCIEKC